MRSSNAEPKVELTHGDSAQPADSVTASSSLVDTCAARIVMHSESSDVAGLPDLQQSLAGNSAALDNMNPGGTKPMGIESSNMEPMKVHVRAKSEDWSLGHLHVRGP